MVPGAKTVGSRATYLAMAARTPDCDLVSYDDLPTTSAILPRAVALPSLLGFSMGITTHVAKIIECASLCCVPGGRDCILATLDDEGFEMDLVTKAEQFPRMENRQMIIVLSPR